MELLALAGQDRRVDRLRQERVAEPEAAGRLVGDEDAVLDCQPQRFAHLALGSAATAQSSGYATSRPAAAATRSRLCVGRSRPPTRSSSTSRRPRGSSLLSSPAAARSSSAKKGLPSERLTIASVTDAGSGAPAWAASSAANSSSSSGPSWSSTPEPDRRTPSASRLHPLGRCELVCTVGREQQNRSVVEVVRKEDDQVERRRIGPVEILEHEQHGYSSCALGEQRQRVLEHPQLRAGCLPGLTRIPQRTQGLDERLVRQVRADEIDGSSDEDVEASIACPARELGREPCLADARFSR